MASSLAWLDTSADEQNAVREVLALFTQPESRDELGIGQVRDVMSNTLFPGSSVIQTRARYFLFVPWCYQVGGKNVANVERQLVETLRTKYGEQDGIIGRLVGPALKTLPSAIYWGGLGRYGILRVPDALPGVPLLPETAIEQADELAERQRHVWDPTMPKAPAGFPHSVVGGMALTLEEASWLRERILQSAPGSLLAQLIESNNPPSRESQYPWHDPAVVEIATPETRALLDQAEALSAVAGSASALYSLMVAELYEEAGNTRAGVLDNRRDDFTEYLGLVEELAPLLQAWHQDEFWAFVRDENPRVSRATEHFVRSWHALMIRGRAALESDEARHLIRRREDYVKGAQSRFRNQKLLSQWGGVAGGALNFRWPLVKQIATDIHQGVARAAA